MFWFDKADPRCLYVDNRRETMVTDTRPGRSPTAVDEDVLADFCNLPFADNTFAHVVFDPPHHTASGTRFRSVKKPGWAMRKYGWLGDNWRDVLRDGFAECFRVLRPEATLVFKWAEKEIPVAEVVKLAGHKPMYGHRSGKQATTHWIAFLKPNAGVEPRRGSDVGTSPLLAVSGGKK